MGRKPKVTQPVITPECTALVLHQPGITNLDVIEMLGQSLDNEYVEYTPEVTSNNVKHILAVWLAQKDPVLKELMLLANEWLEQFWPGIPKPPILIKRRDFENAKALAYHTTEDEDLLAGVIVFNNTYLEYNWISPSDPHYDKAVVETARFESQGTEIVQRRSAILHTLAHELIHLYLAMVVGEQYKDDQQAHGRSFIREANRLGVRGEGRLYAMPYAVRWPVGISGFNYWLTMNAKNGFVIPMPDPRKKGVKAKPKSQRLSLADRKDYAVQYAVAFKKGDITYEQMVEAFDDILVGREPKIDTAGQLIEAA